MTAVMTKITKSEFVSGIPGLGIKKGFYYPVQMLRFEDGLVALMVSIDRDERFIMCVDPREVGCYVTQVFKSKSMASWTFEELCDELTLKQRKALAADLNEGKITDAEARFEAISEVSRLELADDDFPEKEKYRELARKVSGDDLW